MLGNVLMIALLMGMLFSGFNPLMPNINRFTGVLLVLSYVACHIVYQLKIPVEVILFGLFITWATLSGVAVVVDEEAFFGYVRLLVQTWALVLASAGFANASKKPTAQMLAILACAITLATINWATGQYTAGFGTRLSDRGMTSWNPNSFGMLMLCGIMASAYLWRLRKTWHLRLVRFVIPLVVAFLTFSLLSTASRKSFAVLLLFGVLYLWFCYRREVFRNLWAVVTVAVIIAGGWFLVDFMLHGETIMALRWQQALEEGGLGGSRTYMYVRALEMFLEHPIAGVGLGNFSLRSGIGKFSHSEYAEVFSTTGAVGALLYFPIYLIVLWRCHRITKLSNDPDTKYFAGLCVAIVLSFLALGIGAPTFLSPPRWFVMAGIIGYAYSQERALRKPAGTVPRRIRVMVPRRT